MNIVIPTQKLNDAKLLTKALSNPELVDKSLFAVAQRGIFTIQQRTKKGTGINGGFKPYTKQYAAWKRKQGKIFSSPNLEFTGDMMRDMQPAKHRGYSEIYFTDKTSAEKASWNNRTRPFFGFNKKERQVLIGQFLDTFKKLALKK